MKIINAVNHFDTITKHKLIVSKLCFKCGLIKRGLLHDLSKYSPIEFISSVKYYTGTRSPIDSEKEAKGYSLAWQHHKGHNPHHWEYWIDNVGTRKNDPIKIPYEFVVEMLCDWVGASIVYSKNTVDFDDPYTAPYEHYIMHTKERIFHPETQELIEFFLSIIKHYGVNTFCDVSRDKKDKRIKGYL